VRATAITLLANLKKKLWGKCAEAHLPRQIACGGCRENVAGREDARLIKSFVVKGDKKKASKLQLTQQAAGGHAKPKALKSFSTLASYCETAACR
jgi:hypothetical protein